MSVTNCSKAVKLNTENGVMNYYLVIVKNNLHEALNKKSTAVLMWQNDKNCLSLTDEVSDKYYCFFCPFLSNSNLLEFKNLRFIIYTNLENKTNDPVLYVS